MRISVEELLAPEQPNNTGERKNKFFSLANDQDSAIVRFLHTDINDFEVIDVHTIPLGGFNRKINCLKSPNGSKDECALCQANIYDEEKGKYTYPIQRKIFIHLINYSDPQNGTVQIWERSKEYIKTLNQLEKDYGPLYNRLYKITRQGAAGSMETTYNILPLDKDRFNPADFKFDMSQLNYEKALGTTVLNHSNEAIKEYLETGNFPNFKQKNVSPRPVEPVTTVQESVADVPFDVTPPPVQSPPVQPSYATSTQTADNFINDMNYPFGEPRRRV